MNSSDGANTAQQDIIGHFIGAGEVKPSEPGKPVFDPATGEQTATVLMAQQPSIELALSAAQSAFPAWRETPPHKRAMVLFRFRELLLANAGEICATITSQHGKVIDDAHGELGRGIEVVEYACGIAELLKGEHSKNAGPAIDSWSELQPLGVVAGITPFNFPAMVPMWMFPMAIACGNTFILKPSERDPGAALILARLLAEAGLPEGVFNVLQGDQVAANALLEDERVQAVSFVGSTPIARAIYEKGTACGKRVQALGGAKNHAVILPDADIEGAASALMGAAYGSCGERCMAISVAVCVGDETADRLLASLKPQVEQLRIGPGCDSSNDMGPLISADALTRIHHYVGQGVEAGAQLLVDGRGLTVAGHERGFFVGGCLFDKVSSEMSIYTDEIFGPVLCVVRVDSLQQAMSLIDKHQYGNGTCIFTRDGEAARYFTDNIRVGMVGVNVALPVPVASHSFGGWKQSMFGDLYAYGPDAIRFYTRRKTITQRWPSRAVSEEARFAFPSGSHEDPA